MTGTTKTLSVPFLLLVCSPGFGQEPKSPAQPRTAAQRLNPGELGRRAARIPYGGAWHSHGPGIIARIAPCDRAQAASPRSTEIY